MTDHIARRIARIVRAELTAFLDGIENSGEQTRAQKRLTALLTEARSRLGAVIAERHGLTKRAGVSEAELADLTHKAERATELGRDDLARAAITRRLDLEDAAASLIGQIDDLTLEAAELEQVIGVLKARLSALSQGHTPENTALNAQLKDLDALLSAPAAPLPSKAKA